MRAVNIIILTERIDKLEKAINKLSDKVQELKLSVNKISEIVLEIKAVRDEY